MKYTDYSVRKPGRRDGDFSDLTVLSQHPNDNRALDVGPTPDERQEREVSGLPHDKTPGYCYLTAVRQMSWDRAVRSLGYNPYWSTFVGWMQEHLSEWSGARVSVTFGAGPLVGDGRAFTQAHLAVTSHGVTIHQMMNLPGYQVRVGAEVQRQTDAEAGVSSSSRRTVSAPAASPLVQVPYYCMMKSTEPRMSFSPRTSVNLTGMTKYFESAEIVAWKTTVTIGGGEGVLVAAGYSSGTSCPKDVTAALAMPVCSMFSGSNQSSSTGVLELPPDHSFGREVKAVSVGNPDPVLHIVIESSQPAFVTVRGMLTLRVTGVGVPVPFEIKSAK